MTILTLSFFWGLVQPKQVTEHHGFWRPMEPKATAKASATKAHAETVRVTLLFFSMVVSGSRKRW